MIDITDRIKYVVYEGREGSFGPVAREIYSLDDLRQRVGFKIDTGFDFLGDRPRFIQLWSGISKIELDTTNSQIWTYLHPEGTVDVLGSGSYSTVSHWEDNENIRIASSLILVPAGGFLCEAVLIGERIYTESDSLTGRISEGTFQNLSTPFSVPQYSQ